jgi:hypothetical protein
MRCSITGEGSRPGVLAGVRCPAAISSSDSQALSCSTRVLVEVGWFLARKVTVGGWRSLCSRGPWSTLSNAPTLKAVPCSAQGIQWQLQLVHSEFFLYFCLASSLMFCLQNKRQIALVTCICTKTTCLGGGLIGCSQLGYSLPCPLFVLCWRPSCQVASLARYVSLWLACFDKSLLWAVVFT